MDNKSRLSKLRNANILSQDICIAKLEKIIWGDHPICPYCGSTRYTARSNTEQYRTERYHCNACNTSYSVLTGTIFQNTKLPLPKWFIMIYIVITSDETMTTTQVESLLDITGNTARLMQRKIRAYITRSPNILHIISEMVSNRVRKE